MISIIVKLCVGLVLFKAFIVHGNNDAAKLKEKLNKMARSHKLIDGLFRPLENGFINRGKNGVVFKGERIADNLKVAMKFFSTEFRDEAQREYEMYSYLHAINNRTVERYGIAAVYYYAEWKNYMLTVLSLFDDGNILLRSRKYYFHHSKMNHNINTLILLKNFVRQSKYMHSHGVRHDDVKPDNIVLRKHRTFLVDLNTASQINAYHNGGTLKFVSIRGHRNQLRYPMDDWESFLYTMCLINYIELGWFFDESFNGLEREEAFTKYRLQKEQTNVTRKIELMVTSEPLKSVLIEFSKEIFERQSPIPDYNRFEKLVRKAINSLKKPNRAPLFTWLTDSEIVTATEELNNQIFNIKEDIPDPPANLQFNYPTVNYTFFSEQNPQPKPKSFVKKLFDIFQK